MPQQAATIESLPMAFEFVKAMRAGGLEWGEGWYDSRIAEALDTSAGTGCSAARALPAIPVPPRFPGTPAGISSRSDGFRDHSELILIARG